MNSSSQNRSDRLFVFVGSMIPSYPTSKNSKGYVRLKYKILEKTYGNYENDTINFFSEGKKLSKYVLLLISNNSSV